MSSVIDRSEAVSVLSELVRIPSVNPRMAAGEGEGPLAQAVALRLRRLGLEPTLQDVEPGRPNVTVTLPGAGRSPHVLFEAHLDTVSPSEGQADPFRPRLEGDRLYGRGACDTKASVAAMLLALESVLGEPRWATLSFAFTMGEELGHEGVCHLLAGGFRADAAVVGEPTGLDVIIAHKGVVRWRMVSTGRAAHSSNPGAGVNAIVKMAAVISALELQLPPRLVAKAHPLLGPGTMSIGRIQGGLQVNVVPDRCAIEIDRRLLPGETWTDVQGEVRRVLDELEARDSELRVEIETPYQDTPGLDTPANARIVQVAREAVRRLDGAHPVRGVAFCTDAAHLAAEGVPSVVLGPGRIEQAHTSGEYVEVQQVVKAAGIYREIMRQF